nr:fimbria/pilus outer membrane usher protein [Phyllobacterium sp. 628]
MYAGFNVSFDNGLSASSNVSTSGDHINFSNSLSKSGNRQGNAFGWSVQDNEAADGDGGSRSVNASYQTDLASLSGSVDQSDNQGRITGTVEGAVVAAGGGVFLSHTVDDAFAVIKAGGPDVDVSLNHAHAAKTNKSGRALISNLNSYQRNRISIDPANLPLDIQPETTEEIVIPADRSGVVVDFGTRQVSAAVVDFTGPDGKALPVGAGVLLDGVGEPTIAGYDGRTYLTGLAGHNSVTVTLPDNAGTCRATFDFHSIAGTQPEIGPVSCR